MRSYYSISYKTRGRFYSILVLKLVRRHASYRCTRFRVLEFRGSSFWDKSTFYKRALWWDTWSTCFPQRGGLPVATGLLSSRLKSPPWLQTTLLLLPSLLDLLLPSFRPQLAPHFSSKAPAHNPTTPPPPRPILDKHLWLTSALSLVHSPGILILCSQMLFCQRASVMPMSQECQS